MSHDEIWSGIRDGAGWVRRERTAAEVARLVRTAVEVSFLAKDEKAALRARVDAELAQAMRDSGVEEADDDAHA